MAQSILEAIKHGHWDFEPEFRFKENFSSTGALPGTREKVDTLADRVRMGLPLWHPQDRKTFDDSDNALA